MKYVPKLRKNLISLGYLDTDECRVVISKGILKVTKGLSLIMKGQKNRNLYMLQGHIVVGATVVSTSKRT